MEYSIYISTIKSWIILLLKTDIYYQILENSKISYQIYNISLS